MSRRQHGVGAPDRLTFAGHATVLLELRGRRFLTDPVLRTRLAHLRRVVAPPADHLIADLDAVLLSHLHHDHLDLPSLKRLARSVPIITARGAGRFVRRAGFTDVTELRPGDAVEIAGVSVTATFADHDGRRLPRGPRIPALGFLIGDSPRIYFAGDTDLFAGMADLGDLDVALLPVWGWGPSLGPGHLPPERAAKALTLLRPRIAIPIHWGTLRRVGHGRRMRHLLIDPPRAFAREAARLAPGVRVEILEPGESLELAGAPASVLPDRIGDMGAGTIEGLFIADEESGPVRPVEHVHAVAGRGLRGDRYFAATAGPWVPEGEGRDVTLIEAEALEGLAADTGIQLAPGASRRQVVTRGVALNDLVGRRFHLGGVEVAGRELAHPCRHLEKLTQDGVLKGLVNRGGLRAEILNDGDIAVGDPVAVPHD